MKRLIRGTTKGNVQKHTVRRRSLLDPTATKGKMKLTWDWHTAVDVDLVVAVE
jgi:hypothetical protein